MTVSARGWGRIQYLADPDKTMDAWEAWLEKTVGTTNDLPGAVKLMNKHQDD